MNTNQPATSDNKPDYQKPIKDNTGGTITLKQPNLMDFSDEEDEEIGSVSKLVGALNSVDLNSPEAYQNAHSITDNNGGRIELNQDKIIKK